MSAPEESYQTGVSSDYSLTDHERDMLSCSPDHSSFTTPEEAQRQLEEWGYTSSDWGDIVSKEIGSHSLRTLAITALSDSPRLRYVIFDNLKSIDFLRYGNSTRDHWRALDHPEMQIPVLRRLIEESR